MCHLHNCESVSQHLLEEQICLFSVPRSLMQTGMEQLIQNWIRAEKQLQAVLSFEPRAFLELAVVMEACGDQSRVQVNR